MTFEEYLVKKRINREAFAAEDPVLFKAWESMYAQMHQNSFYVAVKMVLNNVRLRYHLREEDVPKPTTTAAPRPAARRAASPVPKPEAETPAVIPAAPDVPQETVEEKPVTPAAAPKPRPVVRRPAALKQPVEGEEGKVDRPAEDKPAEEAAKPAAPRARPVIKRPAALSRPEEQPASEEQDGKAIPEQPAAANASAEPAKPARPRPVIKRPAALQKPPQGEEQPASEMPAEGIAPAGETAAGAPKPPRPRPVIKRPATLAKTTAPEAKPKETKPAEGGVAMPPQEVSPASASAAESGIEQATKPPRPRPIIKRPTPPATPPEDRQITGSEDEPQEGPSPSNTPTAGEPDEQAPKPKPPRPRPIIRRPPPKTEE